MVGRVLIQVGGADGICRAATRIEIVLDSKIRVLAKELNLNLLDAARPGSPELTR